MRLFAGTKYDQPPKCDRCGKLESDCDCAPPAGSSPEASGQIVRLNVEKRKKGKLVTVIRGVRGSESDLSELLSRIKSQCGAGGAAQDGCLEVQGNHVERIAALLSEWGYRVKR